jgi:superfamily I DNA/RNA helicase
VAADKEAVPYWRKCELAWAAALSASNHMVTRLMDAVGNQAGTPAPLITVGDASYRAPDLMSTRAGASAFWEVKFRSRSDVDPHTGMSEYWMPYAAAADYHYVHAKSGSPVWVVLFDASSAGDGTRWLRSSIVDIVGVGRREMRTTAAGEIVDALVWPASSMEVIVGPRMELDLAKSPVLPEEGAQPPVPLSTLAPIERKLRRPPKVAPEPDARVPAGVYDVLRHNAQVGLDVLRQQLGIPTYPRYSVLRIGLEGLDLDEVLGLMRYGIRVFLVTSTRPAIEFDTDRLKAFEEARLLEWAVVPDLLGVAGWWVDGRGLKQAPPLVAEVLEAADRSGGFNLGQYRIVHAEHAADVLVTAGAGTGKTETMSERLVFLLATNILREDTDEAGRLFDLRLDEIALITFTREAAAEMRRRIARTLMLRQRLCDRCVLPATPWLMQLSSTDIDTIHSYAKKIIQRDGSVVDLSPGFGVSAQTMQFRRLVQIALSEHLDGLYLGADVKDVPPEFEFVRFIEELWSHLGSNGLSPLQLVADMKGREADWGELPGDLDGKVALVIRQVIADVASRFRETCLDAQKIPISELVPTATAVLKRVSGGMRRPPRYVFVDEFQDTDAEQMDMVLGLRRHAGSRLFVVGDEKQGIYRFRGAQGSALREVAARLAGLGMAPFAEFGLIKNFRSGSQLLDSLHPWFSEWGARHLLEYPAAARLVSGSTGPDGSSAVVRTMAKTDREEESITVDTVKGWLESAPHSTIAVLCRRNAEAIGFQQALRKEGIPCELRVGGHFFQTPAVVEARVFLEAVLNPDDDAALLELCETRWFGGLASVQAPADLSADERTGWGESLPAMLSWRDRLASLSDSGSFERSDLDAMRVRVRGLARLLQLRPTLAWLVECSAMLQPKSCRLPGDVDDVELHRYQRCLDHLIAQMDSAFADAPISPYLVLSWLRLQIATNTGEDEPPPDGDSSTKVTALTVHKAKGLEFDFVIMPHLSTPFGAARDRNEIAVVGLPDGSARLLWRWRTGSSAERTNVAEADRALWSAERAEIVREEARLLYVAMTRARQELVLLERGSIPGTAPRSWGDLVKVVAGHE